MLHPAWLISLSTLMIVVSAMIGCLLKVAIEQKRRARLVRYVQEADVQMPFSSAAENI